MIAPAERGEAGRGHHVALVWTRPFLYICAAFGGAGSHAPGALTEGLSAGIMPYSIHELIHGRRLWPQKISVDRRGSRDYAALAMSAVRHPYVELVEPRLDAAARDWFR